MTIEEVPDEEPQVRGGVLADGAELLIMDEVEFQRTLKRGQDTPKPKSKQKIDGSSTIVAKEILPPPTTEPGHTGCMTKGSSTSEDTSQKLKDRPIPKPRLDWQYDLRMPQEWNDLIA